MKFNEEKLERFIELLDKEDFGHHLGNSIVRSLDEVLIEDDLITYLLSVLNHLNK